MNLQCRQDLGLAYQSGAQIARVLSEDWCERELYCAGCSSDDLSPSGRNAPAIDFRCPRCNQSFQLKSYKTWNQRKIVDSAYSSMIQAVRSSSVPNLLVMQYSSDWQVKNLLLIPSTFFAETVIEKRPPLGPNAVRAGWVGCNILLHRIPPDGRIMVVSGGSVIAPRIVRDAFARARRLAAIPPSLRGWTMDVLNAIRKLEKQSFSLQELYRLEDYLHQLHPNNRNVRAKIRQQLQVLRDLGILAFTAPGNYSVVK
jgi:type II restriction enzyme